MPKKYIFMKFLYLQMIQKAVNDIQIVGMQMYFIIDTYDRNYTYIWAVVR